MLNAISNNKLINGIIGTESHPKLLFINIVIAVPLITLPNKRKHNDIGSDISLMIFIGSIIGFGSKKLFKNPKAPGRRDPQCDKDLQGLLFRRGNVQCRGVPGYSSAYGKPEEGRQKNLHGNKQAGSFHTQNNRTEKHDPSLRFHRRKRCGRKRSHR